MIYHSEFWNIELSTLSSVYKFPHFNIIYVALLKNAFGSLDMTRLLHYSHERHHLVANSGESNINTTTVAMGEISIS